MSIGKSIFELSGKLGYTFRDITLLENALTHSSYANEQRARGINYPSNERLEFLGDAVLQLLISEHLYEAFAGRSEGVLTKMRQYLVCEKTLSRIARTLHLGDYLNVGHGEELTDCRRRPKVLADALEALIAAIYLDSGNFATVGARDVVFWNMSMPPRPSARLTTWFPSTTALQWTFTAKSVPKVPANATSAEPAVSLII